MTAVHDDAHETETDAQASRFGLAAFAFAGVSLITCYIVVLEQAIWGGAPFVPNIHAQAVVMWVFGLMAVGALARDRARHGRWHPMLTAVAGVALLIFTLYARYDQRLEMMAYVLLFIATLLNQRAMIASLLADASRRSEDLQDFNRRLEGEVARQVDEIGRLERLRRFLPGQVAELVIGETGEAALQSHRSFITCFVCDIRNYTAFAERAEPEETMKLLQRYHAALGQLIAQRRGAIIHRAGDGVMVVFNDPLPAETPELDAIRLGLDALGAWEDLHAPWTRLGHPIGLGVGVASGYATLGVLGDEARQDYTAIGNVVNLAARLCSLAGDGELLVDQRTHLEVEGQVEAAAVGPLVVKGMDEPLACWRIASLREA